MASRGCGDNAKGKGPSSQRQSHPQSLSSQRPQMQQRPATPERPDAHAGMAQRPLPFQDRPQNSRAQKRLVPTGQPAADSGPQIRNLAGGRSRSPSHLPPSATPLPQGGRLPFCEHVRVPLPRCSSPSSLFYQNLFQNFPEASAGLQRPLQRSEGPPRQQPRSSFVDSAALSEDTNRHGTPFRNQKETGVEEPRDKEVDFGPTSVISSDSYDNFMSLFDEDPEQDQGQFSSGKQLHEYHQSAPRYISSPSSVRDQQFSPQSQTTPDTHNSEKFDYSEGYGVRSGSGKQVDPQSGSAEYQQQFKGTGQGGDQPRHSTDCSCSACVSDYASLKIGRADHGANCTCSMCVPEEGGFIVHQESQASGEVEADHDPGCRCSTCCPDLDSLQDGQIPRVTGSKVSGIKQEDSFGYDGLIGDTQIGELEDCDSEDEYNVTHKSTSSRKEVRTILPSGFRHQRVPNSSSAHRLPSHPPAKVQYQQQLDFTARSDTRERTQSARPHTAPEMDKQRSRMRQIDSAACNYILKQQYEIRPPTAPPAVTAVLVKIPSETPKPTRPLAQSLSAVQPKGRSRAAPPPNQPLVQSLTGVRPKKTEVPSRQCTPARNLRTIQEPLRESILLLATVEIVPLPLLRRNRAPPHQNSPTRALPKMQGVRRPVVPRQAPPYHEVDKGYYKELSRPRLSFTDQHFY